MIARIKMADMLEECHEPRDTSYTVCMRAAFLLISLVLGLTPVVSAGVSAGEMAASSASVEGEDLKLQEKDEDEEDDLRLKAKREQTSLKEPMKLGVTEQGNKRDLTGPASLSEPSSASKLGKVPYGASYSGKLTSTSGLDHLHRNLRNTDGVSLEAGDVSASGDLLTLREAEGASSVSGRFTNGPRLGLGLGLKSRLDGGFTGNDSTQAVVSGVDLLRIGGKPGADGSVVPAFEIALESSFAITDAVRGESLTQAGGGLETRDVDIGVRVGFSGFNFDAHFLRRNAALTEDGVGFEAGLSYMTGGFSARIAARQYREGLDLIGLQNEFRDMISYEFGARYRLTERWGLTGGVRYFEYDDHWLTNPGDGENSQMIFLGGSLLF